MIKIIDKKEIQDFYDIIKLFNFSHKVAVPIKIIEDKKKFFNFILPKRHMFCIISPLDYELESIVKEIRRDTPFLIFISEDLVDKVIILW